MVEEGFFNDKLSRTVIESYLSNEALNKIQKLILACTHYPLIQKAIQDYYQGKVEVIGFCFTSCFNCETSIRKQKSTQ